MHPRTSKTWMICLLSLLPVIQVEALNNCPPSFLPSHEECVSTFEGALAGTFHDALEFCGSINPEGYEGYLWAPSFFHPNVFAQIPGVSAKIKVWSGGPAEEEITGKKCPAKLVKDETELELESSLAACSESLPFACAIKKKWEENCEDNIFSDICQVYEDVFCNSTGQLAVLCPKTCGICGLMKTCGNKRQLWDNDVCASLALDGHCVNETFNIQTFCPVMCCHMEHQKDFHIGNSALTLALESNCENTYDRANCPEIPDVDKCFKEPDFMFACQRTCCVLSKTIRQVALEFSPEKRASSFDGKIKLQHCRAKYDDIFPYSVCSQPDACSAKKRKYCEETCCARDESLALVTTANVELTTSPSCDNYEDIYPELVCQIVKEASDCEDLLFRKHCQKTCCENGYEYVFATTTIDPDDECSTFADDEAICVGLTGHSDCSLPEFSGCHYTCCNLGLILSDTTTKLSTPTTDGFCVYYTDVDPETCEKIKGIAGCRNKLQDCEKTCCKLIASHETTTAVVTTVDQDTCEDLNNIYPNRFCEESISQASDCQHPSFRKHCQEQCCLLGFEYPSVTTTIASNDKCLELTDERRRCHAISATSDCDLPKFEPCYYTCCELRRQASISTTATTSGVYCEDYADTHSGCENEINSLADCSVRFDTCEYSCCLQLQELQTTPSVSTTSDVITKPTTEKTTTDEASTEDPGCDGLRDKIAKCAKLNENELCRQEPFKSGCQATCCELSDGQRQTMSSLATTTEIEDCDKLKDLISKCPYKATYDNCAEEPFLSKCKYTCCNIRDDLTSGDTTTTNHVTGSEETTIAPDCSEYKDVLAKCHKLATVKNCDTDPFNTGCQYTCCKLGADMSKPTTATSTEPGTDPTTTVSGDICSGLTDRAVKCSLLSSEMNPIAACEFDMFYLTNCELSCCLERFKAQSEETTTSAPLICNGLENLSLKCEVFNLTVEECESQTFQKKCPLSCCLANGGKFDTTEGPTTTTTTTTPVVTTTKGTVLIF